MTTGGFAPTVTDDVPATKFQFGGRTSVTSTLAAVPAPVFDPEICQVTAPSM